uniref:WD repeat domain phosphoinositide-interacting protein 2 n=1 Tax=Bursaphelenchus xylophilus TaxID=6326 RepID=A0A1I7S897_BURXY
MNALFQQYQPFFDYTVQCLNQAIMIPKVEETAEKELLAVSFNQDCSALAVGHDDGYALYLLRSIESLEKVHESSTPKRTCVIERLFSSSLITFVSMEHTRKLSVYHYQKDNEICNHNYSSAILSVRLNRKRVVVCLEESIHVHNIRDMRLLHVIRDTPSNPLGLVDLSPNEESCYLAYPGSATTGHVQIFDAETLTATCGFAAHDGPLAAIKFSPDSTKIATASEKGTVIRVFEVPTGTRLFEFTRGMKRCVIIHSLAFNADSTLLASSSNTETIHVFSLIRPETNQDTQRSEETQDNLTAWVSYFSQQATAYLPSHMNELMLREKSICTARLPMAGTKTVVGLPKINGTTYLVVATADGYLFYYTIESDDKECSLIRQFRIGPAAGDEPSGSIVPISSTTIGKKVESGEKKEASHSPNERESTSPPSRKPKSLNKSSTPSSASSSPPDQRDSSSPDVRSKTEKVRPTALKGHDSDLSDSSSFSAHHRQTYSDESGSEAGPDHSGIESPHDLNDMDEFPPLKANFASD